MKVTVIPIVIGALGTGHRWIDKGTVGLGNKKTSGDHPDCSITKISQDIEKSPGEWRRFAVAQTPVKNHRLTLA